MLKFNRRPNFTSLTTFCLYSSCLSQTISEILELCFYFKCSRKFINKATPNSFEADSGTAATKDLGKVLLNHAGGGGGGGGGRFQ